MYAQIEKSKNKISRVVPHSVVQKKIEVKKRTVVLKSARVADKREGIFSNARTGGGGVQGIVKQLVKKSKSSGNEEDQGVKIIVSDLGLKHRNDHIDSNLPNTKAKIKAFVKKNWNKFECVGDDEWNLNLGEHKTKTSRGKRVKVKPWNIYLSPLLDGTGYIVTHFGPSNFEQ
ncbi:hypothetical protein [Vibrio coralliilyticus]|uniref:hypothetical protein n=1 Tax=Vibrio coralliilyticus TaxID=190893 RepID=UPI002FCECB9D